MMTPDAESYVRVEFIGSIEDGVRGEVPRTYHQSKQVLRHTTDAFSYCKEGRLVYNIGIGTKECIRFTEERR